MLLLLQLILALSAPTNGSSTTYNPYQYDLAVSQFTPDGRLMQVEYAGTAADRSTAVLAASIDPTLVLIATTRRRQPRVGTNRADTSTPLLVQERLVLVPTGCLVGTTSTTTAAADDDDGEARNNYKNNNNSHGMVVVALSGVLSDCLSLLETYQEVRFSDQLLYGSAAHSFSSPALSVARTMADACQRHAFGGGLRPFGATLLVCGTHPCVGTTNQHDGSARSIALYQTDPSGGLLEYAPSRESFLSRCVVLGGGATVARALERRMRTYYDTVEQTQQSSTTAANTRIRDVLSLLLEEQGRVEQQTPGINDDDDNKMGTSGLIVEAVLVSTTKGVLKLTDSQIEAILLRKNEKI
jgi:20S proteasome alpha/beta subunit